LRVLEEAAIPIDCIAGTSCGALVGAAYAAGLAVDEIERIFAAVRMRDLFRPVWSRDGWLDNGPLAHSFERTVGRHTVADLGMPFAAMATDALTGEDVVLDQGPLADLLSERHLRIRVTGLERPASEVLSAFGPVTEVEGFVELQGLDPDRVPDVVAALVAAGGRIHVVEPRQATLEERFAAVFDNDDVVTYAAAQRVLKGQHTWLETGMVREDSGDGRPA
jgi:NTE family protein